MDNRICYLNTDLVITSGDDLSELSAAFKVGGVRTWCLTQDGGTDWYATLSTLEGFADPQSDIATMLDVIESFTKPLRTIWDGCSRRELNIGYDCGIEPWAFNQGLSSNLLERMASAGCSLRITLYPDHDAVANPATPRPDID